MLHKVLASLLALFTIAFCPAAFAGSYGEVQLAPSYKTTYTISTTAFTPPATPTDIFAIYGSASKTVRILRITCNSTNSAGASSFPIFVLRRSTANTGGTATTITPQPLDTTFAAATCTAKSYTANPTTGTLVGTITANTLQTAQDTANVVNSEPFVLFDAHRYGGAMVLRGTSQGCVVSLNGVTPVNGSAPTTITAIVTEE